jgi:hypothetical protein
VSASSTTATTFLVGEAILRAVGTNFFMPAMCFAYSSRCSGDISDSICSTMSPAVRHISVSVCAGSISTTGIPHAFSSTRSASHAASSANFDAEYGPSIGVAIRPFTLEMNSNRPRDSRSRGSTA